MSENKESFAVPKRHFDDMMRENNVTLDNIEEKKKTCFISICGTEQSHPDEFPYFNENRKNLLTMFFDDIEEDMTIVSSKNEAVTIKAFTEKQAKELFDFIKSNSDKKFFIVHCAAGVSRSGAVATFINDYFRGDYKTFKKNNRSILPNGLVLSLLNKMARQDD